MAMQHLTAARDNLTAARDNIKKGWEEYPNNDKGAQVKFGCQPAVPDTEPYIHRLRSDLANSYYWKGQCWMDYIFFCCNWQPWLGILFAHPNHPWSKFDRIMMTLISFAICLVPSAMIATGTESLGVLARTPATIVFVTMPNTVFGVLLYQLAIADTRAPCCRPFFRLFEEGMLLLHALLRNCIDLDCK